MRQLRYNGEELRKIRDSKKIELIAIAEITRISKRYLEYIECDEYRYLPAIPYLRGYLEQYAKCLRLDPDDVSKSYLEHYMDWLNKHRGKHSVELGKD